MQGAIDKYPPINPYANTRWSGGPSSTRYDIMKFDPNVSWNPSTIRPHTYAQPQEALMFRREPVVKNSVGPPTSSGTNDTSDHSLAHKGSARDDNRCNFGIG